MNTQDQRFKNNHIVHTMACKACFGRLIQKHTAGQDVVLCATDPTHEGFITQAQAMAITRQQHLDALKVLQNYPQFNPNPLQETSQESIDDLYLPPCPPNHDHLDEPAADLDAADQWMHEHGGYPYQEGSDPIQEPLCPTESLMDIIAEAEDYPDCPF